MEDHVTSWWSTISLRTKITGVTVLLVTLGLIVAGFGTMTVLKVYLNEQLDSSLQQAAQGVTSFTPTSASTCNQNAAPSPYFFAVLNIDGDLLCHNMAGQDQPDLDGAGLSLPHVLSMEGEAFTVWNSSHTSEWRVIALSNNIKGSSQIVNYVVGVSLDSTQGVINQFIGIFLGFGLSIVVLGAALTRLLVTSTFTPLREVEATAAAIADGDFSQRLPGATPNTEVGRLNRSLNTMLGRIDRAFADRARTIGQMRRFVGDASHELRTPLVSVRGYAELYRMGALQTPEAVAQAMERIEKEAIRMGELVQDLLELARIDEAKPLQLAPVDLLPIARDAALDAMASAPSRVVTVVVSQAELVPQPGSDPTDEPTAPDVASRSATTLTGPIAFAGRLVRRGRKTPTSAKGIALPPEETVPAAPREELHAVVLAEENKIRQVVTNLMGNAMRFTPDDSPIEIAVSVDGQRRVAILDVIDHGDGIPPQIREKIFERFWRADTSRTRETGGSGLGLAIVSGIIANHRGTVEALETHGGGATFRVELPLLPEDYVPPVVPSSN
ncbi:sensor histidine kinase [Lacisediminihabitans changchengi]|uniref:histidine kinase n=1 Tax=Lacisediminihabitans changchengi TaxID=2787634 RepID=A0A934W4E8_9MICO|nr:HAMP domain-containing sensor histidine kinase [Lacisediminihabitans changchengi]MBK4348214.1 HAMP domain-containing protein [Lacisediminihabitans changchengi]